MAVYAHLALQNHDMPLHDYLKLPERERAFMAASDLVMTKRMNRKG